MIDIADGLHPVRDYTVERVAKSWPFANEHKDDILRHWQRRSRENPKFFNGRVHIMLSATLQDAELRGEIVETDFASSLYWRENGFADSSVADCFAAALLICADGALIFGRQAPGNVNAGLAYPPSGFLDERDIRADGLADLAGSAEREVLEETGLTAAALQREDGFLAVRQGPLLCVGVTFRSPLSSDAFLDSVTARLRSEDNPELEAVIVLKTKADIARHPMPAYAKRIAEHLLKK